MQHRSRFQAVLDGLTASAVGVLVFLVLYGVVWTLIPYLSNSGLPVDTIEEVAWSREWPLGIYRHPPMMVWLLEIAWKTCGGWLGSPYLASATVFGIGTFAMSRLVASTRPATQAGFAALLTPLVYFFGPQLPQWNANVVQLPFAGLFLLAAWRGVMAGSLPVTMLAGLLAAGGVLGKYSFALIPLFAAVGLLAHPVSRARIRLAHIGAAFLVFVLALLPHVWWFFTVPVNTLDYLTMSAEKVEGSALGHLTSPLLVLIEFVGLLLPAVLILLRGTTRETLEEENAAVDGALKTYLGAAVLGPVVIAALVGAYGGGSVKDQWLIAYMLAAPAMMVVFALPRNVSLRWKLDGAVFFAACLVLLAVSYPAERLLHYARANGAPVEWAPLMPIEPLKDEALALWNETLARNGQAARPPMIVAGGFEAAGIANTLPVRPAWLEHYDPTISPWVRAEMIRQSGILATEPPPQGFIETYGLCLGGQKTVNWLNGRGQMGRTVALTVLLPGGLCHP